MRAKSRLDMSQAALGFRPARPGIHPGWRARDRRDGQPRSLPLRGEIFVSGVAAAATCDNHCLVSIPSTSNSDIDKRSPVRSTYPCVTGKKLEANSDGRIPIDLQLAMNPIAPAPKERRAQ